MGISMNDLVAGLVGLWVGDLLLLLLERCHGVGVESDFPLYFPTAATEACGVPNAYHN